MQIVAVFRYIMPHGKEKNSQQRRHPAAADALRALRKRGFYDKIRLCGDHRLPGWRDDSRYRPKGACAALGRTVDPLMKKKLLFVLLLTLGLLLCGGAFAQNYTFDALHASCTISDSYILLTPDNLEEHPEWLANQGTTVEELKAAWSEDGVLLEAWNGNGDVRIRISAVQDDQAALYYDLDQQETKARTAFRTGHTNGTLYASDGITYTGASWKRISDAAGRFLTLTYKQTTGGNTYYGLMRRTVRNGYTVTVDYRVSGRKIKNADKNALVDIMTTWKFNQTGTAPSEVTGALVFISMPPAETNTGSFTVEGTCGAGLQVIGVVMRMTATEPIRVEATASKSGKFSLDVKLTEEGIYLMTVSVLNGDDVVAEKVFDTTTYQKNLLPVNLDSPLPTDLTSSKTVISGKTLRNTTVQCIVGDYRKQVRTNASGKFSFTLDTADAGNYELVLSFQKKGYSDRRFTQTMNRTITEEEQRAQWKSDAVKPAYSTLTKKLTGYTGRIMGYSLYVVRMDQAEDGTWEVLMAMDQKKGAYRNMVVVTTAEEPSSLVIGTQVKMYGRCTGSYVYQNEDGTTENLPCFELLFWD